MILRLEWLGLLRPDLVGIPRRFRVSIEGRWLLGSRAIGDGHGAGALELSAIWVIVLTSTGLWSA